MKVRYTAAATAAPRNSFFPSLDAIRVSGQVSAPPAAIGSPNVLVGKHPPDVVVMGLDWRRVTLGTFSGRPAVITFWATWCVPCKDDIPLFAAAFRAHRDRGLTFVAIDYEESPDAVALFWKDYGLEPTPYLDPDGSAARRFGVGLNQSGLPVTIFVGQDGKVRLVFPGEISARDLAGGLNQILPL